MKYMYKEIKQMSEYCLNCKTRPCIKGCPLNNRIPDFIYEIKNENYKKAYEILTETSVLSSICGIICPHNSQCEGECIRGIKQVPVSIGKLEEFVSDIAVKEGYSIFEQMEKPNGKKVAVIGSGPASLTCAAFLAKYGFKVTIFEKRQKIGGILRYGIPDFRLDQMSLNETIKRIIDLGIEVKINAQFGKDYVLEDLQKEYNAIFIGIGANKSCKMGILGENLQGVYGGNELLEYKEYPDFKGKKVSIIGGGNVAIDVARVIKSLGANEVMIIYRRAEKHMPAEKKEVQIAKNEGIKFVFQTNLVQVIGDNKVKKLECIRTELVKKEGETREIPINIENSNFYIDMDFVIMAIGAKPENEIIDAIGVECTKYGYIKVDENYMTSKIGVFAGGDLIGEKQTVAWAARSGREAAKAIKEYLM